MSYLNILVYCPDAVVLDKMLGIIAAEEGWEATGTTDDESALELFQQRGPDLVVMSEVKDENTDKRLKSLFIRLNKKINILTYAGGDDWFLKAQINTIMGMNDDAQTVLDNPFR